MRTYEALGELAGVLANRGLVLIDSSKNDSSPSLGRDYAVPRRSVGTLTLERAPHLEFIYGAVEQQTSWVPSGLSGTFLGSERAFSPTAYPLSESTYVEFLKATKRDLEGRVAALEGELAEIRVFWPTIKKLIEEYTSAGRRVGLMQQEFAARHLSKGALEIAKARDVLDRPLDENFFEEAELMAAQAIQFANYATFPKPHRVYADSNFAFNLLCYELNHTKKQVLRPIDTDCYNFYQTLMNDGVELVGSVYTFSEVLHVYCFSYPRGMYELSVAFLQQKGLRVPPSKSQAFKCLLRSFPQDCEAAWQSISHRVAATEEFFDRYQFRLLSPLPSPKLTNITRNVLNFASILKDFFVAIEATDALHLSIAAYLNSDAVISLDRGFLTVDGFTVYHA